MDPERVARECWQSVTIAWTGERWLYLGLAIAAVVYPLWVSVTGATVFTIVDISGLSVSLTPWLTATTALAVALALLWIVGPAGIVAYLVHELVTNPSGNLKACYRVHHPSSLYALPVAVMFVGLVAALATGSASIPLQLILLGGGMYVAIRTSAYASRVFALSLPWIGLWVVFLGAAATSVAMLDRAAAVAGRSDLTVGVTEGLATRLGVPQLADVPREVVSVAGVDLPLLVAVALGASVGISAAYVALQLVISTIQRVRRPTVKRSTLRTGQRHPSFARTTVGAGNSRSRSSGARSGRSRAAGTARSRQSSTASDSGGTGGGGSAGRGESTAESSTAGASTAGRSAPERSPSSDAAAGESGRPADTDRASTSDDSTADSGADTEPDESAADSTADAPRGTGFPGSDDADEDSEAAEDGDRSTVFGEGGEGVFAGENGGADDGPSALVCGACERSFDPDLGRSFCPHCGARLQQQ